MSTETCDHAKPPIAIGDHVHLAWWWLLRERFDDVRGRVVRQSPSGHYSYVASLDGRTYQIQTGNLEHTHGR